MYSNVIGHFPDLGTVTEIHLHMARTLDTYRRLYAPARGTASLRRAGRRCVRT